MDISVQRLQFLDLTDATENDQTIIEEILFSSSQSFEVPWFSKSTEISDCQAEKQWSNTSSRGDIGIRQSPQCSNQSQQENDNGKCDMQREQNAIEPEQQGNQNSQRMPPQRGIFPGIQQTSLPQAQMYQMLPSLSNVYVSNVTANVNVHAPYVQPIPAHYGQIIPQQQQQQQQQTAQQIFSSGSLEGNEQGNRGRRQRQKTEKKREGPFIQANEVIAPPLEGHPPPQLPSVPPPMPPYYISGTAGTPVYMMPVYPSPMFGPYTHGPGPGPAPMVYPQANNVEHGNVDYQNEVQGNFHTEGVVVVGCDNGSSQRRAMGPNGSHCQISESGMSNPDAPVEVHREKTSAGQSSQTFGPPQGTEILAPNANKENLNGNYCGKKTLPSEDEPNGSEGESSQKFDSIIAKNAVSAHGEDGNKVSTIKNKSNGELDVSNVNNSSVICKASNHMLVNEGAGRIDANNKTDTDNKLGEPRKPSVPESDECGYFPGLEQGGKMLSAAEAETASGYVLPSSGGKSWASLFNRSEQLNRNAGSDKRGRPLARVLPYNESESYRLPSSQSSVPLSLELTEGYSPAKINGSHDATAPTNDPYLNTLAAFLCKYELEHKIISLQPRGLTNRSNWCYVNAILQSLIACPPFYNLLKALPIHKKGGKQTMIVDALVEFANEFSPMPVNARIGKREKSARNKDETNSVEIFAGTAFEPSGIYKILNKVRGESSFNVEGRQEDAEEFLSCLLNGLNDEMFELMKSVSTYKVGYANGEANGAFGGNSDDDREYKVGGNGGDYDDDDSEWNVMGPKNRSSITRRAVCGKTPVSDIFRGQFRSRVQRAGDQSTDTVQPFFTLQLDIEKANSVKDALDLFMGKDPLEGVTCSRTHQEVEAWTQTTLEDLPLVLILHLKCYDYKSDACSKIIKSFDFQVDLKIEGKLLSNRNKYTGKQRNYKLVAVVYHDGKEASKGHYVTDAYHVGYGCWLRYDDVIVRSVPESHVLKPRAPRVPYLLYYRRADTIGPSK